MDVSNGADTTSIKLKPVASHVLLGIAKHEQAPPTSQRHLSPMVEACSRMDLTAIHQILVMTHYRDDERTNELSFQEWTQQMRDTLEARKRGDFAFCDRDFKTAIDCYTQEMVFHVAYIFLAQYMKICWRAQGHLKLRNDKGEDPKLQLCCLSYVVHRCWDNGCVICSDQPDAALRDAMMAQGVYLEWPTTFYMLVALAKLEMPKDAAEMLNEAAGIEKKRQRGGRGS